MNGLSRVLACCVAASFAIAACTSSNGDDAGSTSTTLTPAGSADSSDTTQPPNILALTPNIDLAVEECWAELPPPTASTTTTTTTDPDAITTTTEPVLETVATKPEPLGDLATTIPMPTIVAMVDCQGSNEGQVFARFCLGANPESDDPTKPSLAAVGCDTVEEQAWPGDRVVRRAAVRVCLEQFRETYGENYSESELVIKEFTPTEGIWNRGLRSVVCWIDAAT